MQRDLPLPQRSEPSESVRISAAGTILDHLDCQSPVEGIYVHVPFCAHRCHYCDFFTVVGRDDQRSAYVDRLLREIDEVPDWIGDAPRTIFIGGGTPTYLPPADLQRLLAALGSRFGRNDQLEFSVEANPETVNPEVATVLAEGGVNRVSLGVQSFDRHLLKSLQRRHDPSHITEVMEWLRRAGIDDLSLDLIFAIPGQTLKEWKRNLGRAVESNPTHLSCYGLIYEPGTPLRGRLDRGEVVPIDQDLEAEMYEFTGEYLQTHGWEHYEISNWSRPGRRCQHNLLYWQSRNWWPLGPSGSGHVDGWRWRNTPRLGSYLAGAGLSEVWDVEHLDDDGCIGEWFMMGLRCNDGLNADEVEVRLQAAGGPRRRAALERHQQSGLLHWRGNRLVLTPRGRLLANLVTTDLLAEPEGSPP